MEGAIWLEAAQWTRNPIRFIVLDFSLVPGVGLSSSEALVRIQRWPVSKGVTLVGCGFVMESYITLARRAECRGVLGYQLG